MVPNRTIKEPQAVYFLEVWSLCLLTKALPKSGGLLDQDSFYMHLAKNAFRWKQDREQADMHKAEQQARARGR